MVPTKTQTLDCHLILVNLFFSQTPTTLELGPNQPQLVFEYFQKKSISPSKLCGRHKADRVTNGASPPISFPKNQQYLL